MTIRAGLLLLTVTSLLAAVPAPAKASGAQDGGGYQLPPAAAPPPNVQGPVIPEAPPPRVAQTVEPTPVPSPTITLPLPPEPAPSVTATAPPPPAPRPSASASANAPVVTESPAFSPPADAPSIAAPTLPSQIVPAFPTVAREDGAASWPWAAGALAALGLGTLALFLRRRTQRIEEPAFLPPILPVPAPPPTPDRPALALELEAVRMSASLVNATLAYRLRLTAGSDLEHFDVRADMTAAHASRPADEQLGADDAPVLHNIAAMAAGETLVLTGELRLPLRAITPIRHGSAALFVPLVRIVVDGVPDGSARIRRAFVVGLDENANTLRLQPFRLDQGPRVYAQLGQRELTVPQFA